MNDTIKQRWITAMKTTTRTQAPKETEFVGLSPLAEGGAYDPIALLAKLYMEDTGDQTLSLRSDRRPALWKQALTSDIEWFIDHRYEPFKAWAGITGALDEDAAFWAAVEAHDAGKNWKGVAKAVEGA